MSAIHIRKHNRYPSAEPKWQLPPSVAILILLGCASAWAAPLNLYSPAPETFTTNSHVVSTTVFHWFTSDSGQITGPWRPHEGRSAWTGEPAFWRDQVKQMMSANIDVMYVHLLPHFEPQRIHLFQSLNELRAQGYDVPKVAPFLDPVITWDGQPPVDLATTAGKNTFVDQYTRFFNQYYSVNQDAAADSYLAQMNGRVHLDTWHVFLNTTNVSALTRADVESRLSAAFADAHPIFNQGIYMVTTVGSPTLSFANEKLFQFEDNRYYAPNTYNNYRTAQLKAGYWDQNIRDPGSFVPRDGGAYYATAWNQALQSSTLKHVNVESWNEYDEGTGVYRADPGPPYIAPGSGNTNTDTWSATNDPLEYVKTTANGARAFNDTPDRNARILWHDFPTQMQAGQSLHASVIVRNEGDLSWTGAQDFKFGQQEFRPGEVLFGAGRFLIDDATNEIPTYGGIFRGRPVTFDVELIAPTTLGTFQTHWGMLQELVTWFGQELTWEIVVLEPSITGDLNGDGFVDIFDVNLVASHWGEAGPDGDANGDMMVDIFDINLISANWSPSPGADVAVPEPSSISLLRLVGLAAIPLLGRGRRRPCCKSSSQRSV